MYSRVVHEMLVTWLFTADIKLYGKEEYQVSSLLYTVYIFSTGIRMNFGLKKCEVL